VSIPPCEIKIASIAFLLNKKSSIETYLLQPVWRIKKYVCAPINHL